MPKNAVTQKEINEAHRLKKMGLMNKDIAKLMQRSLHSVAQMLKKPRCPFA